MPADFMKNTACICCSHKIKCIVHWVFDSVMLNRILACSKMPTGEDRPIAFASKTLAQAE